MAASVLCRRTAASSLALNLISSLKPVPSLLPTHGPLLQTASYNPRRLNRDLEMYIPDRDSETTPKWQKTARYDRKLFGRYGSASGIDPASLWPSHKELDKIIAEEKEWYPPLDVMRKNIAAREKEEAEKRLAKEKLIAANMAKMPQMIADWRRGKREAKIKLKEDKARRDRLLVVARERFGFKVDPRSHKFIDMVKELEKEEKRKMKLVKRRQKEEKVAEEAAAAPPAPDVPPPPAAAS